MFGVFLVGEKGSRVGELDEEMVYESRVGDVFLLGSSAWRIEDITHDRVLVTPAPGQPGRMPYWHGDAPGRPIELGRALGRLPARGLRRHARGRPHPAGRGRPRRLRRDNLLAYLAEQREATTTLPDDRTILVERFRDELGDWRLAIHSPFGAQVNQPWALALTARLRESYGVDVQSMHSDDGIVLRLPETEARPTARSPSSRPRTSSPRCRPRSAGRRCSPAASASAPPARCCSPAATPRAAPRCGSSASARPSCWPVASQYGSFPVVLETMREVLQDVFDVPGLCS
jgi:ATP-dependent Lhr-like helicase